MKKILLSILSSFVMLSAGAFTLYEAPHSEANTQQKMTKLPDNEDHIVFGYCQDYYTGIGTGKNNDKLYAAIEIPADVAQGWVGNELSHVRIALGPTTNTNITLFLSEKLGKDSDLDFAFYTQTANLSTTEGWNEIQLETPYKIEGKNFYIGYQVISKSAKDYPLGIDGVYSEDTHGDIIGVNGQWANFGTEYGSVCLQAVITGDALPQNDVAVRSFSIPPHVQIDQPFSGTIYIRNQGFSAVESIELGCSVNGEKLENITYTLTPEVLNPGGMGIINVNGIVCSELGADIPVVLTIDKVNGQDDDLPYNNEASGKIVCVETVYPRNVVVEEWTGIWCGWCVRGIVGMEYMNKTYPEGFIGIAIHANDAMQSSSYSGFIQKYGGSYPGCIINRKILDDPNQDSMETAYLSERANNAVMQINADVDYSEENPSELKATATVNFAFDSNTATYRVSFAIIENNVGPYRQTNSYAGGRNGAMGGWESKSGNELTYYNDVARVTNAWEGAPSSIPAQVEKGVNYTYSAILPTSSLTDIDNCELVAMIINSRTSEIENACKIKITDNENSGIKETLGNNLKIRSLKGGFRIEGDYRSCVVYGLAGNEVKTVSGTSEISLAPGMYIVNIISADGDNLTHKLMVK